ncbi:hypothetical protein GCM10009540_17470 [Streptomyces turgidiscabies]
MTDGVDAGQYGGDRVGVPHVQAVTQVEHDRLVAPRGQGLHDMTPDEPGSAGDQYSHGWNAMSRQAPYGSSTPVPSQVRKTSAEAPHVPLMRELFTRIEFSYRKNITSGAALSFPEFVARPAPPAVLFPHEHRR